MTTLLDTPAQTLLAQLDEVDNSLSEWGFSLHQRMDTAYNRHALNGYATGAESFLQTAAILLCRHVALQKFDQFMQGTAERLHAFNTSAMRVLDATAPPLHFDLGVVPSRDASLSNAGWDDQAYTAFFHLMDCGRVARAVVGTEGCRGPAHALSCARRRQTIDRRKRARARG
ncbi:MAG: hypothetical protein KDE31_23230 [Caldilineaceae bacterium]|nr:hypothetical protein [Caldilineaceae bacterium]